MQLSIKDSKLAYEGLLRDLAANHELIAPDWTAAVEARLVVNLLISCLPHELRHMLHYRMLGFSWKEAGGFLGISPKQAKTRFYRGVQKAYETLLDNQAKRRYRQERK